VKTTVRVGARYIGLIVAFAGGGVYAFFAPAFNVATNDNFGLLAPGVPPLSIYATDFYFAAGFTGISLVRSYALLRPLHQRSCSGEGTAEAAAGRHCRGTKGSRAASDN